jgi:CBS domain-containing protein
MSEENVRTEVFKVSADETVAKVKEIVAEGNVRRIIIQNEDGKTLIEFPLTVGVAAAAGVLLLVPLLAAVGVLAAIVTDLTIVVEREE